jgi:poly(hydroxyalkanoate) depolymerase family esterase
MTFWLDLACHWATPFSMPPVTASSAPTIADLPGPGSATGGRLSTERFHDADGQRIDYQLFLPNGAAKKALPLVVMLHGHSQELDGFIAGTSMNEAAAAAGFAVLYPAQSSQSHPQKCWHWFDPAHQHRDLGEPALLAALTRSVMQAYSVDARKVYVAGLSAGGAMATIMGCEYPDLFAGVGVHSGLAAGVAHSVGSALASMRGDLPAADDAFSVAMPTIVFHGDADRMVHQDNGQRIILACTREGDAAEEQELRINDRSCARRLHRRANGTVLAEHWIIHQAGHAWSGGSTRGSFADAQGPDASAEMLRFFTGQSSARKRVPVSRIAACLIE